jgi:exodeoxyribonuclease V beta subunit
MTPSIAKTLKPESIPLTGHHLIEASAGTGKTFNITRIYLRLLLESKLDVKNILVMTFTRAATEELRGRIAGEIRHALDNWGQLDGNDSFFHSLQQKFTLQDIQPVLHNALLHLDEASIFTIHSFCKRVLTQQAFNTGVDFNVLMETDTADLELEAVRDWYRVLSPQHDRYLQLTQNWLTPESFYQAFHELFSSSTPIQVNSADKIIDDYKNQKLTCLHHLKEKQSIVFSLLIDSHKQKDSRSDEWHSLLHWLQDNEDSLYQPMPKDASMVFNATRFGRDAEKKQVLIDLFATVKQLKTDALTIEKCILQAKIYQLAATGINIIRSKIIQAKKQSRVMNYDDLINQLADSLINDQDNMLSQQIRAMYPVALVDEFQDTDPQQYLILNCIYHSGSVQTDSASALYMIGDPKQAIYAFRSGDIFTYLAARENAQYQWIMDTNWRSSTAMINAYNRLFHGSAQHKTAKDIFGFGINYSWVKTAAQADKTPLMDKQSPSALEFIYFPFNESYQAGRSKKEEMKQEFCPVIAAWCCSEIHRLLTEQTKIGDKVLQEQDIAILVRDKREAAYIQEALSNDNYSSVYLSTHENIFASEEAKQLELALNGIINLENDRLFVAGLSSCFFGCDAKQLFLLQTPKPGSQSEWEFFREKLFELREMWLKRGFMSMALQMLHQHYHPQAQQHQRALTNVIQLLELLQNASQQYKQPEQLFNWLRERIKTNDISSEAELRLESDANLIRIITQHGSKGLEYPIVFIPFATRYKDPTKFGSKTIDLFKYHNRDNLELNYFIGQDKEIISLYKEEAWAETIRLLYVATTRAKHRCYICATAFANYHLSPLGLTLQLQADQNLYLKLQSLIQSDPQSIRLQQIDNINFPIKHAAKAQTQSILKTTDFSGFIERNWWLSSFSALTRNLRHGGISTPDRDQDNVLNSNLDPIKSIDLIRFTLTKGPATGNLLHDILEHSDFSQPQWDKSMQRPLARFNETLDLNQQNELIYWLTNCLDTPLPSGPKLNQLKWSDTLRESEFYFPMQRVNPNQLAKLLFKHRSILNPTINEKIQLPGKQSLYGMMHGFIDLVFQWHGKYYIADYKSTHLGGQINDYERKNLEKNIRDNYYDLQYLIYSLALHRYLKFRITDYDPQIHFGGIYYLYLRGMQDQSTHGIFFTTLPADLLNQLDELFASEYTEKVFSENETDMNLV